MDLIAVVMSLPIVLAGAWYAFNAGSIRTLAEIDGERANAIRVRLRRVNGAVMLVLGFVFYFVIARTRALGDESAGGAGWLLPLAVLSIVPLFLLMLLLVWLDWRMTRRLRRGFGLAGVLVTMLTITGCGDGGAPSETTASDEPPPSPAYVPTTRPEPQNLPTADVVIGDRTYTLMVADDPDERAIGLMHRREMADNEGMIFLFKETTLRNFYMKDTYVPLDVLFLDEEGRLINVDEGRPLDDRPTIRSDAPTRTVIELRRGQADAAGIQTGDAIDIAPALEIADVQ
ncbi:MAG: DUF192 domain-containing protein [Planctomycetota bacterium]